MKGKKPTPDQIITKLREAELTLNKQILKEAVAGPQRDRALLCHKDVPTSTHLLL